MNSINLILVSVSPTQSTLSLASSSQMEMEPTIEDIEIVDVIVDFELGNKGTIESTSGGVNLQWIKKEIIEIQNQMELQINLRTLLEKYNVLDVDPTNIEMNALIHGKNKSKFFFYFSNANSHLNFNMNF